MQPPDTLTQVVALVRDLAFPIAVAWFVLTRLERALVQLTAQMAGLRAELAGRKPSRREDLDG
jgi:hypothetical protein